MEDIKSQITYFQKGRASYAFMVNSFGRAMIHPLLPTPSGAFEDPIFMDITAVEPTPEFGDVIASILRFVSTLHLKVYCKDCKITMLLVIKLIFGSRLGTIGYI